MSLIRVSTFRLSQPTARAPSLQGERLASEDFQRIANEFLASVRRAPHVDAVYLSLHGAMSAQNEDDPEGFLLAEIRKILGENIPIVVSLDLHGILTDRMLQHSDAVVVYHTYPHVDFFETGERAARLLLRILSREVKPVTARVAIPALVRGDELITETGLFGKSVKAARALNAVTAGYRQGCLSAIRLRMFRIFVRIVSWWSTMTLNEPNEKPSSWQQTFGRFARGCSPR